MTTVIQGKEEGIQVVLTKPLSLERELDDEYRVPNILQRILSLFKNVRPGSDLTRLQLPPLFNFPKSQLQCYGESVYCTASDLLNRCNNGESSLERFASVVAWSISTTRPLIFGVSPFNPILGETHHVSRGNLNILLEQVSHHPPLEPKFHGTSVEAQVHGKRKLKLLNHGETYEMNSPHLLIRILPVPGVVWVGNVTISCPETGLVAELCYISNSFLGFKGNQRLIKGKIFDSSSKILYEVDGHWDKTVTVKDTNNGKVRVIYDAKEAISGLKTPTVKDAMGVWPSESAVVWSESSQGILSKDWEKAREAKKAVEDKQRELSRERESRGETWVPKHFIVTHSKEGGWDSSPIQKWVPPAPIVASV
ncbi:Oxysterol-binding protein [Quillaja saponaria]|uniref:Oxysterol-binding protein n=1 Tax=Quillaja saponaria TaxID=32244 RepID=A0AAD7LDQ2_QUISA|nr:Oxysterol-binding protein [Quillaja saponaria]